MYRENARELDDGGGTGSIVVGARCVLCRLESRQRPKITARTDARIVMASHHQHPRGVAARQPREHIDDVDHWPLGMTPHLHHCGIVLDAETPAARFAVAIQLVEQILGLAVAAIAGIALDGKAEKIRKHRF